MNKKLIFSLMAALILTSSFAVAANNAPETAGSSAFSTVASPAGAGFYTGTVTIYPNGSVSVPGVLSQSGNTYGFLENLSGSLIDERNNSLVNGNGLTINGATREGVLLSGVTGVSVTDLKFINTDTSVYAFNDSGVSITKLNVDKTTNTSGSYGIYAADSSNVLISGNVFNGTPSTIYVSYVDNLSIVGNTATNVSNEFIYVDAANNILISGNSGSNVTRTFNRGLDLEYVTSATVKGNTVDNAYYGLYVYSDNYLNSSDNQIKNNGYDNAITFEYSNYISSSHDNASDSLGYALYAYQGNGLNIQYDNFNHSAYGSLINLEANVVISHSNFSNVTNSIYYGLEVSYSGTTILSYDSFNETTGPNSSVYLYYQSGATVMYMDNLYGAQYGLFLEYVSNLYVNSTRIDSSYPVYNGYSSDNTVFNSDTFVWMTRNTALEFSGSVNSNIAVVDSTFVSAMTYDGTGIYVASGLANNVVVSNNDFINVYYAVYMDPGSGQNYNVSSNVMNNTYLGIEIYYVTGLSVTGNQVLNAPDYNIELGYVTDANVSGNLLTPGNISYYPYAIYIYYSSGPIVVSHNTLTGNSTAYYFIEGVYLYDDSNAAVFDNKINAAEYALDIEYSYYVSTFGNTVTNSTYGIYSYYNQVSTFYGNTLVNSSYGAYSYGDYLVSFYGNTFHGAIYYFAEVDYDVGVTYYHNNFLGGNRVNVSITNSVSVDWNMSLPVGGNYWSNYTGTGVDGIGTTPYAVGRGYMDYLPLTSRWASPTVTFVETGLPSGTAWQVTLGQTTITSSGNTITFQPSNGQYVTVTYSIRHESGYVASVNSSSLLLSGSSRVVTVSFSPYTYAVTFTETGLASGTSWSVTLNGATRTSGTAAITFNESNGTYTYSIGSVTGYSISTAAGSVTVSSGSGSVAVKFTENSYTLTLVESGLSPGQTWTVTVNGTPHTVTGNSLTLSLVPGTYTITAAGPSGYSVTLQSPNVTIGHSNTTFAVGFQSPSSSSLASGTGLEGIGIGAVIGIIVGLLVGLVLMPVLRGKKNKGGQQ